MKRGKWSPSGKAWIRKPLRDPSGSVRSINSSSGSTVQPPGLKAVRINWIGKMVDRQRRTTDVLNTWSGVPSRSNSSPAVWSSSASVSTQPAMAVPRCWSSGGPSSGKARICCRTSGETFSRNHARPSALTATEDWVRGRTSGEPSRAAAQLGQRQFHCGTPPPAAEPRMRTCMAPSHEPDAPARDARFIPGASGYEPSSTVSSVLTYAVTSMQRVISTKSGVLHCIGELLSFQGHQEREQIMQFLDGQHFGHVLGHERFLQHSDAIQLALLKGVELAVLLAELDAEVGLVDAEAGDGLPLRRDHGHRLVIGIDVLGRVEDRFHDVLGRAAVGDAIQGRPDPASLAIDAVALGALGLALGREEELAARLGIALDVRLPGTLARGAGQAADVEDQLGDLLILEGLAESLHGGLGDAFPDDASDVLILVAVNPAVVGQVGPLAAATRPAVTAAAQPAEESLSLLQRRLILGGERFPGLLPRASRGNHGIHGTHGK